MMYHLLPGEKIVWRTKGNELILTTHRIRWQASSWGEKHIVSIMLEEVKYCEIRYNKSPILGILAVVAAVLGIFGAVTLDKWAVLIIGVGISALFFGLSLIMRRLELIVSATDLAIVINTGGWDMGVAIEFVDKLEAMKDRRYFRALERGSKAVPRS